jgi:hypothetical protein
MRKNVVNKLVSLAVVAWLGVGTVVAAGAGFVAYGFFMYFGTGGLRSSSRQLALRMSRATGSLQRS